MRKLWWWLTRYMVAVQWEDVRAIHWARTMDEANAWASCYRSDAIVMVGKRGRLIASRY